MGGLRAIFDANEGGCATEGILNTEKLNMKKCTRFVITTALCCLPIFIPCRAAELSSPKLDLWYDLEIVTDHSATYSTVDSFRGDFHLVVQRQKKNNERKLILKRGDPHGTWLNEGSLSLEGHVRSSSPFVLRTVNLIDKDGKAREIESGIDLNTGKWSMFRVPLIPSPAAIARIELIFDPGVENIELDDLKLVKNNGVVIQITDKPLDQRIAEAKISKNARIDDAFAEVARKPPRNPLSNHHFARLWGAKTESEMKSVNEYLYRLYTSKDSPEWNQHGLNERWNLGPTLFLIRCYNTFGSRAEGDKRGRLEKRTEDALLQVLWDRTIHENDIYITRNSTLAMDGSENHDLDSKVASLLASKIFMERPDWADKVLPNAGKGSGSGYWFHKDGDTIVYGPEGLADWRGDDRKQYVSRDHYNAWVKYFHRFVQDRAKSGFFLEKASGHYMDYTMGYLFDMYN